MTTKGCNGNDAARAEERRLLRAQVEHVLAEARSLLESIERDRIKLEVMRELIER
jgi:hypothetical protein